MVNDKELKKGIQLDLMHRHNREVNSQYLIVTHFPKNNIK